MEVDLRGALRSQLFCVDNSGTVAVVYREDSTWKVKVCMTGGRRAAMSIVPDPTLSVEEERERIVGTIRAFVRMI